MLEGDLPALEAKNRKPNRIYIALGGIWRIISCLYVLPPAKVQSIIATKKLIAVIESNPIALSYLTGPFCGNMWILWVWRLRTPLSNNSWRRPVCVVWYSGSTVQCRESCPVQKWVWQQIYLVLENNICLLLPQASHLQFGGWESFKTLNENCNEVTHRKVFYRSMHVLFERRLQNRELCLLPIGSDNYK